MTTETTKSTMMILYNSPRGFANESEVYIYDSADPSEAAVVERIMDWHRNREPGDPAVRYTEPADEYERRVYKRRKSAQWRAEHYIPITECDWAPDEDDN